MNYSLSFSGESNIAVDAAMSIKAIEESAEMSINILRQAVPTNNVRSVSNFKEFKIIFDSIRYLSACRSAQAVPVLYDKLTIFQSSSVDARDIDSFYPCVSALISIGKPASLYGINELANENSALRRTLIVQIVRGVEGEAVGQFMLQQAIYAATNTAEKANLQKALKEFEEKLMWETKEKEAAVKEKK